MKRVAILSFWSGINNRGVESWAQTLKEKLDGRFDIQILSGSFVKSFNKWKKSDIIVATNGRAQVFFVRIITFFVRKPLVVFGHSGPGADDKWNLLCSPDVFVTFSTVQKKWAEEFKWPWTRVIMIPHGVDTNRFKPASHKPRNKIVLNVAADLPAKRIGLVKNACTLIGYKFLGYGRGNDNEVPFDQMPQVYRKADIFCFTPKPWEAFGLVFLEAMASNLPVVTCDDPIRREIVGDAGVFVKNPENTEELSRAIKKAYYEKWGNIPYLQAEKFSWDKMIKKYNDLFDRFI